MSVTIEAALKAATEQLQQSGSDSPALDAAVLLCHVLAKPRSYLLTWPDKMLEKPILASLELLLARRRAGEPIAYILGEREFWSLPLKVSPSTLIPRPDTERLVELALDKAALIDGNCSILAPEPGRLRWLWLRNCQRGKSRGLIYVLRRQS